MKFARTVWKILVAIKDGLVLALLLLFFGGLSLALSMKPLPGRVKDGALAIAFDGPVVEERSRIDPSALLLGGGPPAHQLLSRDLVRAIEAAADDSRIHAVTLDLENFSGGNQVTLSRIGAALDKVRHAGKPVLARAMIYDDAALLLAAHASEVWVDPMGGALVRGPGGTLLFYRGLLDKLKVKAHVFKVGTYKSAVEPFIRDSLSPEAKQADNALYGALWHDWLDDVHKARPKADLTLATANPAKWLAASGGDAAKAALAAGLVDRIGDKVAFGQRVAELVGADTTDGHSARAGNYKATWLGAYLGSMAEQTAGKPIAVVTIAGAIVDGKAGPGSAGGDRITALLDKALATGEYSALVVRVDSPGGSVTASERIRAAIMRFKSRGIPVAVSMGNLAASGGYWVSTPGDRIFAEPATITGSIGIFAIIPSFEDSLTKLGVTTDSIRTTPLSGQPDVMGGLSPEVEAVVQSEIDQGYQRFIGLVAAARHKTPGEVDKIAQGRVWDGGTARQIGLIDEFGDLDAALQWAAGRARLNKWHAVYLDDTAGGLGGLVQQLLSNDSDDSAADDSADTSARALFAGHAAVGSDGGARDMVGRVAMARSTLAGQMAGDLDRLLGTPSAQVYCLECAGLDRPGGAAAAPPPGTWSSGTLRWLSLLVNLLG